MSKTGLFYKQNYFVCKDLAYRFEFGDLNTGAEKWLKIPTKQMRT